jgi:hypothetical protein
MASYIGRLETGENARKTDAIARAGRTMDQGGQGRAEMDAAAIPAYSEPTPSVSRHPLNRGFAECGFVTLNPREDRYDALQQ